MVADLQSQQNVFQRTRQLTGAQQERGRLFAEGVDDFGAIGKRKPVMERDVRTGFHFRDVDDAHAVTRSVGTRCTRAPKAQPVRVASRRGAVRKGSIVSHISSGGLGASYALPPWVRTFSPSNRRTMTWTITPAWTRRLILRRTAVCWHCLDSPGPRRRQADRPRLSGGAQWPRSGWASPRRPVPTRS